MLELLLMLLLAPLGLYVVAKMFGIGETIIIVVFGVLFFGGIAYLCGIINKITDDTSVRKSKAEEDDLQELIDVASFTNERVRHKKDRLYQPENCSTCAYYDEYSHSCRYQGSDRFNYGEAKDSICYLYDPE